MSEIHPYRSKNFFDDSMKHIMSDFNNMVMYLDD